MTVSSSCFQSPHSQKKKEPARKEVTFLSKLPLSLDRWQQKAEHLQQRCQLSLPFPLSLCQSTDEDHTESSRADSWCVLTDWLAQKGICAVNLGRLSWVWRWPSVLVTVSGPLATERKGSNHMTPWFTKDWQDLQYTGVTIWNVDIVCIYSEDTF